MVERWEAFVEDKKQEKLFETEDFFQANQKEFRENFLRNFDEMCTEIVRKQERGELSAIAYLDYTLLFHYFIQRQYLAEVRVYGEKWFYDQMQIAVGKFDVSVMFGKLTELWDSLLKERKAYVGTVSSLQVKENITQILPDFFAYIGEGIRLAILSAVNGENFRRIQRTEKFEINVGQFMGNMEAVYKVNQNKDRDFYLDWFRLRLKYAYMFEDLSGMDFSEEDLSEIDFRYSDFRNGVLKKTDIEDSMLFGTRFCYADMEGVDLKYSMIFGADFTGANLQGANFVRTLGNAGVPNRKKWSVVGFPGVSFRNADLRGADFTKARLSGADFTGARMEGAIFERENNAYQCLNEEQQNVVIRT